MGLSVSPQRLGARFVVVLSAFALAASACSGSDDAGQGASTTRAPEVADVINAVEGAIGDDGNALIDCAERNASDLTNFGFWSAAFDCDEDAAKLLLFRIIREAIPAALQSVGLPEERLEKYEVCLSTQIEFMNREDILVVAANTSEDGNFGRAMFDTVDKRCELVLADAFRPPDSQALVTVTQPLINADPTWTLDGPTEANRAIVGHRLSRENTQVAFLSTAASNLLISAEVTFSQDNPPGDIDQVLTQVIDGLGTTLGPEDLQSLRSGEPTIQIGSLNICTSVTNGVQKSIAQGISACPE